MSEAAVAEDFPAIDRSQTVEELFNYWFVRYNPLYLASAFCVLVGVFLLSKELGEMAWQQGKLLLTAIIEVYEFLLVGSAALLSRFVKKRRSAVILAFIAAVFCLDATFQTEVMACFEGQRGILAALWVVLAIGEMRILVWVLRLRTSLGAWIAFTAATAGIAFTPQLMDREGLDPQRVHELATWYAIGLVAWVLWRRPQLRSEQRLDAWGLTVLQRSRLAVGAIWATIYTVHWMGWATIHDVNLSVLHALPCLLLLMLFGPMESLVWGGALPALFAAHSMSSPPVALAICAVLVWRARQKGWTRLLAGALLALHVSIGAVGWSHGAWLAAVPWLNGVLAVALLVLAWRMSPRDALLGGVAALLVVDLPGWAQDSATAGMGLLGVGFLALIAGVAIDWRRGGTEVGPAAPPGAHAPG